MKNKEDIINSIITKEGYTKYLELGYQDGYNFNKIKCKTKVSVDINGKADFNDGDLEFFKYNDKVFDCVFVDSLHEKDHVRKVIVEAMKVLDENGCIILHDVCPPDEKSQIVPREQKIFCGDTWKAAVGFHQSYPDIRFETYRSDYGLTFIYPEGKKVKKHFEKIDLSYDEFKENEVELLCIID